MISAANLRPPLSGNKDNHIFCWLACIALFGMSCSTSKKTVRSESIPEKKSAEAKKVNPPIKVDTVIWKEKKLEPPATIENDKITTKPNPTQKKKITASKVIKASDAYQILLLLPLNATENDTNTTKINPNFLRYIHFYAGMEMASLENNGALNKPISLKVHGVSDSEDLQNVLEKYKNNLPHLIIGPQKVDLIKEAANWSKENQTTLISPWVSGSYLVESNPFYIQVKPNLTNQYRFMNEHARKAFAAANIILILKDDDEGKEQFFNDTSLYPRKIQVRKFKESDLVSSNELLVQNILVEHGSTVFILPMGSNKDEEFVYHFLRRVSAERDNKDVVVYGMSKWLEMKSDVFDLLHAQKVRMSAGNFSDGDSNDLKNFKRRYFDRYREFPTEDVLEGYDLMNFCLKSLNRFGTDFHLDPQQKLNEKYLQTDFDLIPMYRDPKNNSLDPDYYENSYIRMIELKNNRLKVVE
ncbi:MAG: hypothetical protein IPH93_05265 [Saprospiraceae bacterium]|nr:hypothetical protein [Saprospiraceae bacterium]MBK7811640.1 hypothetical protein [Saprospiraceae bacterium]